MMKKFLLVGALMCAMIGVAASAATASIPLRVTGAGASTTSGQVVVNARATGPTAGPFFPVAPAVGFLRAPDSYFGNLSGRVTCMSVWLPGFAVSVSGTLDTPLVL